MLRAVAIVGIAASALGACGGGSRPGNDGGVVVIPSNPTPTPTPASTPTPKPTPTPSMPVAVPAACTVQDAVHNPLDLRLSPVSGTLRVVAIGSSSTAGNGASSPSSGYVAVMQTLLASRADLAQFVVVNAGVGGDTLGAVQDRLQRDALSLNPQLVILQVGVNDASAQPTQAGVDAFSIALSSTVSRIKPVAQVVLVTGQYFPQQPSFYESYMDAMNQVGEQQHVAVFDRYSLMKGLITSGQYSFSNLLAADALHPNDVMHRCMGKVLAELISSDVIK
jgi:acyl-CoA thioesterase-1